jgi:TonB family protein
MPTRAFLLCDDEKAVDAVTQILRELAISFEHFPEASLALKRLASQRVEAVLVDCDNETNAALVFDVVRKSGINQDCVTIAIVDGKAGVPKAFRLGASMVLTKPVSLEQARGTVRNALALHRKGSVEIKTAAAAATHASPSVRPQSVLASTSGESLPGPVTLIPPASPPARQVPMSTGQADAQRPEGESVASAPAARGAAARVAAIPRKAPSAVPGPAGTFRFKEELPKAGAPRLARAKDRAPAKDNLALPEFGEDAGSEKDPVVAPSVGQGRSRRKTNPYLLAALAGLLVAAGFYTEWMMKPGFRGVVLWEYGRLHLLLTGTGTSPRTVSAPKAAAAQVPSQAATTAKPLNPASKADQPAAASASNPLAEGFGPPQDTSSPSTPGSSAANKATAPVLLSTSATQKADSEPVVVPAEVADDHVAYRESPIYPNWVHRKRFEGDVVVQAAVNKDGTVDSVLVVDGDTQLAAAAVQAIKKWRYETYYHNGRPVAFQTQVTVRFELPKKTAR